MPLSKILTELDEEITKLKQARALLSNENAAKRGPGRPKKIATVAPPANKKRNISPEGRKRIADAVKRRWAKQKKGAAQ